MQDSSVEGLEKATPKNLSGPCLPLWKSWPEQPWPCANVLLEGPSILNFDRKGLLFGPVIAVNHALRVNAPVDFWATTDHPERLWKWARPYRMPGLRYFTTDQNLQVFAEKLGPLIREVYSTVFTEMWLDKGLPVILPTLIPTLSWLRHVGVRRVRLFGCDMHGMHSPIHSSEPFQKEDPDHSARWKVERVLLSHVMRRYRAEGAEIRRWHPERKKRARR